MYKAYVTHVTNIRPAKNADRLNLCEVFGNTVIVDKTITEDMLVLYFPSDGQISVEFGERNNLFRKKDDVGNNIGGFIDSNKRNIKAINLRGNRSDGLVLPLSCLDAFGDTSTLKVGDTISVFNGHEICQKYIPARPANAIGKAGNRARKKKVPVAPLFMEHADTEQLAYNLAAFRPGDQIEITLKMHGTSQRTGYLPVFKGYNPDFWGRIVNSVDPNKKLGKLARSLYERALRYATPIYDWGYVSGTRRTVLENYDGGYYGSNEFREAHSKIFEGKLWKGETVYYEVVGFTQDGAPIMATADNRKVQNPAFTKQYGKTTTFSYGCVPNPETIHHDHMEDEKQSALYVYRMTLTTEDGDVVEYTPDFMRYRCEQMGVNCVPVFWTGFIPEYPASAEDDTISAGDWVRNLAERFYDGPDPVGKTHVREGIVVRVVNRPKFTAYKHKNHSFKVLEGIIKDSAAAPDMEEAQEVEV